MNHYPHWLQTRIILMRWLPDQQVAVALGKLHELLAGTSKVRRRDALAVLLGFHGLQPAVERWVAAIAAEWPDERPLAGAAVAGAYDAVRLHGLRHTAGMRAYAAACGSARRSEASRGSSPCLVDSLPPRDVGRSKGPPGRMSSFVRPQTSQLLTFVGCGAAGRWPGGASSMVLVYAASQGSARECMPDLPGPG